MTHVDPILDSNMAYVVSITTHMDLTIMSMCAIIESMCAIIESICIMIETTSVKININHATY